MPDADWRDLERRWRESPTDQPLLARTIAAFRRASLPVPVDLLAARVFPARTFESREAFRVEAVKEVDGAATEVGATPGPLRLPRHRSFLVAPARLDRTPADKEHYRELYDDPTYGPGIDGDHGAALAHVVGVLEGIPGLALDRSNVEESHLASLERVSHVEWLRLRACHRVGAPGLERVARALPRLYRLELVRLPALASLEPLAALEELGHLRVATPLPRGALESVPTTLLELEVGQNDDAFLAPLGRFANLRRLALHGGSVTDALDLPPLRGLTELDLSRSRAGDEALRRLLPRLPALEVLNLAHGVVTDAGLEAVASCSTLREVDVSFCASVTSAGFEKLARLARLQRLIANGGKKLRATQARGRDAVAAALPRCKVLGSTRQW